MRTLWFVIALCIAFPAHALDLSGQFVQGGLVVGQAEPGSMVTLDGLSIDVASDGAFVFGFGRDANPSAQLVVTGPDGGREVRDLAVAADGAPSGDRAAQGSARERRIAKTKLISRTGTASCSTRCRRT